MIRTILLLLLMTGMILPASAQLTLEECQRKAQDNYPLVTQYQLIRLSEEYSLANAAKGNLPQISLSGKASYQSDATTLPFEVPGVSFRGMPKDQYQVMVEVRQTFGMAESSVTGRSRYRLPPRKPPASWTSACMLSTNG